MSDVPSQTPPEPAPSQSPSVTFSIFLACLLMGLFLSAGVLSQVANMGFGIWFTELCIFLGVPFIAVRLTGRDPASCAGLRRPAIASTGFGFLLGAANFLALVVPLQALSHSLAPKWLKDLFPDASQIFENQTPVELALIITGVGFAAAVCEEYFFRGVFQRGLTARFGGPTAVVVTAVLFSAFHLDPIGFLARFELGVLFGLLFWRTGSIWPSVGAHAANNLVSTGLYFAFRTQMTDEDIDLPTVLVVSATGMAGLAALLSIARRSPSLLSVGENASDVPLPWPPPSPVRLVLPWFAGALASIAVLWGVDRRGVQLNLWDARYRLPELKETATPQEKAAREQLQELRKKARRGEVPLDDYVDQRRLAREEPRRL